MRPPSEASPQDLTKRPTERLGRFFVGGSSRQALQTPSAVVTYMPPRRQESLKRRKGFGWVADASPSSKQGSLLTALFVCQAALGRRPSLRAAPRMSPCARECQKTAKTKRVGGPKPPPRATIPAEWRVLLCLLLLHQRLFINKIQLNPIAFYHL